MKKQKDIVKAILLNDKKKIFLIEYSEKFYDLPGGSVEPGEDLESALLRELDEETGFKNFKILEKIAKKRIEYKRRGEDFWGNIYCFTVELVNDEFSEQSDPEKEKFEKYNYSWVDLDYAIEKIDRDEPRNQAMKEFLIGYKNKIKK